MGLQTKAITTSTFTDAEDDRQLGLLHFTADQTRHRRLSLLVIIICVSIYNSDHKRRQSHL